MFCKKCGKKIADDSIFCEHCGESQTGTVASPPRQKKTRTILIGVYDNEYRGFEAVSNDKETIEILFKELCATIHDFTEYSEIFHENEYHKIGPIGNPWGGFRNSVRHNKKFEEYRRASISHAKNFLLDDSFIPNPGGASGALMKILEIDE